VSASQNQGAGVPLAERLAPNEMVLRGKLEAARKQSTHSPSQGGEMENLWIEFLREYLPLRYKIDRGFVADSKGQTSAQIDCIIYDALYTPRLYGGEDNLCVPVESIYAVFESKSLVNKEHIEYADQKAASVRNLHRSKSATTVDRGEKQKSGKSVNIISGLLAVSLGNQKATITKHFGASKLDCVLVSGGPSSGYWDKFEEDVSCGGGKGALIAGVFRFLSRLQSLGTVPPIDWKKYEEAVRGG